MSDIIPNFIALKSRCITGDATVLIKDGNGMVVQMRIRDLWEAHQEVSLDGRGVKVYAFDPYRNNFYFDNLRDVVNTGIKEDILAVELASGRRLEAVAAHRVLSAEGLRAVETLEVGSQLVTVPFEDRKIATYNTLHMWSMPRGARMDEVVSLEDAWTAETFDIDMYGTDHNYVANGIVVRTG